MKLYDDFEKAMVDLSFEASDEKLVLWKQLKNNHELFQLVKLAMDFAWEEGYMEGETEE